MIRTKRVYEPAEPEDGMRILVDRLWPRGIAKGELKLDLWLKEVAPSTELRRWFAHDPAKWDEFKRRYRRELAGSAAYAQLRALAATRTITLLYAAKETRYNNATALQSFLEEDLRHR